MRALLKEASRKPGADIFSSISWFRIQNKAIYQFDRRIFVLKEKKLFLVADEENELLHK